MTLKEIQIKNFRSIKDETIVFDHNCMILLGKNEAGKSNILKAIAAVFGEYTVTDKDRRKRTDNEKIEKEDYYVMAVFKLSISDHQKILNEFKKRYIGTEKIILKSKLTLNEFISKFFNEILIRINISDGSYHSLSYWTPPLGSELLEEQLFITDNVISNINIIGENFNIFHSIFHVIQNIYKTNFIKCHYWRYSDDYLLPNSINVNSFIRNPDNYKALENIFQLCERGDIETEFENAESEDGDYSNLLDQVSKKVTFTFQKIWKDFKDTSIQLLPNGEEILVKVVNKAKYSFEDRSDGFKKFISILLMLSTKSRANRINENDIILIDEPDQSLYPTSAKYLKDELIEISKKSKVVFSTHSQYMIDSNCLDRHLIVEKNDDVTTLRVENNNAPFSNDELLRRAIGSSIFECLQPVNIIFEGWLDKELFIKHCEFYKKKREFSHLGVTYLGGISGAESLVSLLQLANKKFIVVADSDETSKNKRIEFEKNYPEFKNNWIGYSDLASNYSTMEDFFDTNYLIENILKHNETYTYDDTKNALTNIDRAVPKDKAVKQQIKNSLIKGLKKENIKSDYVQFINLLKAKIAEL